MSFFNWRVCKDDSSVVDGSGEAVLWHNVRINSPEIVADLALAAAAPDLLDALYLALPYVEVQDGDEHYKPGAVAKTIAKMKAAIAKAEGR